MGIVAPLSTVVIAIVPSAVLTAIVPIGYLAIYRGLPSMIQLAGFMSFMSFMIAIWLLSAGKTRFKMAIDEPEQWRRPLITTLLEFFS